MTAAATSPQRVTRVVTDCLFASNRHESSDHNVATAPLTAGPPGCLHLHRYCLMGNLTPRQLGMAPQGTSAARVRQVAYALPCSTVMTTGDRRGALWQDDVCTSSMFSAPMAPAPRPLGCNHRVTTLILIDDCSVHKESWLALLLPTPQHLRLSSSVHPLRELSVPYYPFPLRPHVLTG